MDLHIRNNLLLHASQYLLLHCRSCADCNAVCTFTQYDGSKSTSIRSIPRAVLPKPEPGWGRPWQSSFPVPATKSVCQSACITDAIITMGCWQVLSPTRKQTSYSDQTRNLFKILPTKLNTLLIPLF